VRLSPGARPGQYDRQAVRVVAEPRSTGSQAEPALGAGSNSRSSGRQSMINHTRSVSSPAGLSGALDEQDVVADHRGVGQPQSRAARTVGWLTTIATGEDHGSTATAPAGHRPRRPTWTARRRRRVVAVGTVAPGAGVGLVQADVTGSGDMGGAG
jgi:hypothetical protein